MKETFTANEAARECGVSPATICAWAKSGKFEATKTKGGRWMITLDREDIPEIARRAALNREMFSRTESHRGQPQDKRILDFLDGYGIDPDEDPGAVAYFEGYMDWAERGRER